MSETSIKISPKEEIQVLIDKADSFLVKGEIKEAEIYYDKATAKCVEIYSPANLSPSLQSANKINSTT